MDKIVNLKQVINISKKLRSQGNKIVLAGGCFDILHVAHVKFFEKAKQKGDALFVLLESDDNVTKLKGKDRPINSQKNRGMVLSALSCIDYVILLPDIKNDAEYDAVVSKIRPSIIATTIGDPNILHKKRQANQVKAKVVYVLQKISDQSTTKLARLIEAGSKIPASS